ncbi:MAG: hypothetical protein K2G45_11270 [Lachnospiraceae bacterium]|nr:hypothetical protein [Lachnospiraceae bacterium]
MNNKAVNKYIRMIKKALPPMYNNRKLIIHDIKRELKEYSKDKEACTFEELVDVFGSPETVADEYMAETISSVEFNKLRRCYIMFNAIVVILCVVTLLFCNLDRLKKSENNNLSDQNVAENNEGFYTVIYEMHGDVAHEVETHKREGFHIILYETHGDVVHEIINEECITHYEGGD